MVTLQEVKQYLRVDFEDDDTSASLSYFNCKTAGNGCWKNGRGTLLQKTKMWCGQRCSTQFLYLYENSAIPQTFPKLTLTLRAMLFAQREGVM
ncbi:head-tail connector protein [Ruminococcus sp.]|uniref:head-tail connector protein n=1 Tax=Ruminococcus sp. TaxID=41978 RepID=UPI0039933D4A